MNKSIYESYKAADGVIFQSIFAKKVVEQFFGMHNNTFIIHNGTCLKSIQKIPPIENEVFESFDNIWVAASTWRPHKRLNENVKFFLNKSSENDCLVIAGPNVDYRIDHDRIFYFGNLQWESLISLYKKARYFLHLAWLDCCPNVVIDARACGCKIICSNSGGTSEISGRRSLIVQEEKWKFEPVDLYNPPRLNFDDSNIINGEINSDIDIKNTASLYVKAFKSIL